MRVILDLGPASKGHALVIPKTHAANLFELPDETAEKSDCGGQDGCRKAERRAACGWIKPGSEQWRGGGTDG